MFLHMGAVFKASTYFTISILFLLQPLLIRTTLVDVDVDVDFDVDVIVNVVKEPWCSVDVGLIQNVEL